ncbi:hypothetical protein [Oceanobacter mangrovi]|uniref:hypothetical protein n=1 Tax=Oceanobacter mangrovi TaxID=2862510 RepID=UPI001C8DCF0C|nr:hypothetical protein [Oceanobacter mangrovi]
MNSMIPNKAALLALASSGLLLTGCGSDSSSSSDFPVSADLDSENYVVFSTSSNYDSSQVTIGNLADDRNANLSILTDTETNYSIDSYNNQLYYFNRTTGTTSQFSTQLGSNDKWSIHKGWTYSVNDTNADTTANPYTLVHQDDDLAWVIRYGATSVWQVDTSATKSSDFKVAEVDLSAYTVTGDLAASAPNMADAVISNGYLFVLMQRLNAYWAPQTAYVAVIDLETLTEVDTDPQTDGLQGIELNVTNPGTIVENNGVLYISGHGPYSSNSGVGIDEIDASTFAVTSLVDNTTLETLNDTSGDTAIYYHISDVTVASDNLLYFTANMEQGYTTINTWLYQMDPTSDDAPEQVDIQAALNSDTSLADNDALTLTDITIDTDSRLWVGVANSDNPGLLVLDTDTNSQNGEYVNLELIPQKISFLSAE